MRTRMSGWVSPLFLSFRDDRMESLSLRVAFRNEGDLF
ncbi:hypothetical protein EVA_05506 [gut metagenome]|uniref:Uncharacterized protein n=1 Tax=gut metagenome TaxID=749906 RepID=J9GG85_9ZZZZ